MKHITLSLTAPGMTPLHRAGLGGLACTLSVMGRNFKPYYDMDDRNITLRFGTATNAANVLKMLFNFAFGLRNGLIFLPGQYGQWQPPVEVLAKLQQGLLNSFLQHNKWWVAEDGTKTLTVTHEEESVTLEHKVITSYDHQGWFIRKKKQHSPPIVNRDGTLKWGPHDINGKLLPGCMVRHNLIAQTKAKNTCDQIICLYFGIVGCVTLSVNYETAVTIIPEVTDLREFARYRPTLTPQTVEECRIAGAADASLSNIIKLRAQGVRSSCAAIVFKSTSWNMNQKIRTTITDVQNTTDLTLDRFERAARYFPDCIRQLMANNIAHKKEKWYTGFTDLIMTRPKNAESYREQLLKYNRKALQTMAADEKMWDETSERVVIQSVHEAMRCRFGQIAKQHENNPVQREKKFGDERNRWWLAFSKAKTPDQFRKSLSNLFGQAGRNSVLQKHWQDVLPMIRGRQWQYARDLSVIALCSYVGQKPSEERTYDEFARSC